MAPHKKKRCRQVLQIWHEKGKWTMATLPASQQRQSPPASAALPLAHQPGRGNFWKLPSFLLRISHALLYMAFGKKHHELFKNTYHIQDLKNQKSQYFPVNINIQCTHVKLKTCFVKYFKYFHMYISMCTWTQVFPSNNQRFFSGYVEHFASVTCFLPTTCLVALFPILQLKHHHFRWDMRRTNHDAGFCRVLFSHNKKPRETVIVREKKQKTTTYSIDGSMGTEFLRALGV